MGTDTGRRIRHLPSRRVVLGVLLVIAATPQELAGAAGASRGMRPSRPVLERVDFFFFFLLLVLLLLLFLPLLLLFLGEVTLAVS